MFQTDMRFGMLQKLWDWRCGPPDPSLAACLRVAAQAIPPVAPIVVGPPPDVAAETVPAGAVKKATAVRAEGTAAVAGVDGGAVLVGVDAGAALVAVEGGAVLVGMALLVETAGLAGAELVHRAGLSVHLILRRQSQVVTEICVGHLDRWSDVSDAGCRILPLFVLKNA